MYNWPTLTSMDTKAKLTDNISELEQRNRKIAFEAATEGIVLLENHGCLPLKPCKLALYGAGAQYTIKGGSGSGEVNVRHNVSTIEGLETAGFDIVTKNWISRYDKLWKTGKQNFLKSVRRKLWWPTAKRLDALLGTEYRYPSGDLITQDELSVCDTDYCIYVLSRQSGEGHDLEDCPGSFRMDEIEVQNIRLCASHFAHFILLINTGTPIDLSTLDDLQGIDAVVYMGQLGMEGGNAVAAVLTGKVTPSGKLAVSWPSAYKDVPFGNEFGKDSAHAPYKEGIYVGYRYYDSFDITPRYPFGYGLSYTHFALDKVNATIHNDRITCSARVKNIGKQYAGKQVVQVYVRCPGNDREYQRLVTFAKTDLLNPGEGQTLELSFHLSTLSCYDQQSAQTIIEAGDHLLSLGFLSRETRPVAAIHIDRKIILTKHNNLCVSASHIAELTHTNRFSLPDNLPRLTVNPNDLRSKHIDYSSRPEQLSTQASAALNTLSTEDCIKFCAGTGMSGENRGFRTPGAVGHTTTDFFDRGIPNAEMCDGPAGIRLERRAVLYPSGNIKPIDVSLSIYEFLPELLLKWLVLGNPQKGQILYQFVTGFPIEAMVAQTWNIPLAAKIGKAVGEEMNEYGVTFWLAPAMNIVRNPLCGRNYEYFSEDPLLTGLMAAAITNAVQSVPNKYVTFKHFCANNQETARRTVSADVDERVLREIYWKGFEIAVKTSHPRAVMAAYNKLNGVYCANNSQLCNDLLRCEWNFDGIVMTDWMSTGKELANEAECLRCGTDLIMPGGEKDVQTLLDAYRIGCLKETDIRRAAGRLLQAISHLPL